MEVTQKEFADLAGVSKAAVSKAVKQGRLVKTASRKIDTDDGLAKTYLLKNSMKPPAPAPPKTPEKKSRRTAPLDQQTKDDHDKKFDLATLKTKEEIGKLKAERELKELKVDEAKGSLIEKDRLARIVFGYLEGLNLSILDSPEIMADHVIDLVKSGKKRPAVIKYMREILSRDIQNTKKQIKARLN